MMSGWKRVGKLSGPANVLNSRFGVVKGSELSVPRHRSRYYVVDLLNSTASQQRLVGHWRGGYLTMRDARSAAEVLAGRGGAS